MGGLKNHGQIAWHEKACLFALTLIEAAINGKAHDHSHNENTDAFLKHEIPYLAPPNAPLPRRWRESIRCLVHACSCAWHKSPRLVRFVALPELTWNIEGSPLAGLLFRRFCDAWRRQAFCLNACNLQFHTSNLKSITLSGQSRFLNQLLLFEQKKALLEQKGYPRSIYRVQSLISPQCSVDTSASLNITEPSFVCLTKTVAKKLLTLGNPAYCIPSLLQRPFQ